MGDRARVVKSISIDDMGAGSSFKIPTPKVIFAVGGGGGGVNLKGFIFGIVAILVNSSEDK